MSNHLLSVAQNNTFFHDFIAFLNEVERMPLELTATRNGNIKIKEIKRLGQVFKHDIYHRDKKGKIMFATRSEDSFPYIWWHKQLSGVMHLTYVRKQKIRLSKNGKGFLNNITPDIQFREMILWYLSRADWRYINYYRDEIAEQLQDKQLYIWQFLLKSNKQRITPKNLYQFTEQLIPELAASKLSDDYQQIFSTYESITNVIKKAIIQMLKTFDLIDTKEILSKYGSTDTVNFRLNEAGIDILTKAMNPL